MKLDTIVELDDNQKYYVVDETFQNNKKYFLTTRLDQKENITTDSIIFEENKIDNEMYLKEVKDKDIYKYILSIFTSSLIKEIEEKKEV